MVGLKLTHVSKRESSILGETYTMGFLCPVIFHPPRVQLSKASGLAQKSEAKEARYIG